MFIGLITELRWYLAVPLGIVSFIATPILLFLLLALIFIMLFIEINMESDTWVRRYFSFDNRRRKVYKSGIKATLYKIFVCFTFWLLLVSFMLTSAFLMTIILTIPVYIINIFIMFRMIYWWNAKKRLQIN